MDNPETTAAVSLSEQARARIADLMARYPTRQSALMPSIWVVQEELQLSWRHHLCS